MAVGPALLATYPHCPLKALPKPLEGKPTTVSQKSVTANANALAVAVRMGGTGSTQEKRPEAITR